MKAEEKSTSKPAKVGKAETPKLRKETLRDLAVKQAGKVKGGRNLTFTKK